MKRFQLSTAILLFGAAAAFGQESAPVPIAEAGVNFSAYHAMPGGGYQGLTLSGGSAVFAYNFNKTFSAIADLGGYHNPVDGNYNPTTFTYMFGPRVSFRRSRITPYVQSLFGGARLSSSFVDPTTALAATPRNGFAAAFGGGMDVKLKNHIVLKPFQLEYMVTRVANPWSVTPSQNNFRYSAGAVYTFGSR